MTFGVYKELKERFECVKMQEKEDFVSTKTEYIEYTVKEEEDIEQCAGEERKVVEEPVKDDANRAIMSTHFKGPDLNLDPGNPPKYCPQCACTGVKSKVKKLKVDPASQKLVIMCKNEQVRIRLSKYYLCFILFKCPWPFSVKSPDEVTVTDRSSDAGSGEMERREDTVGTTSMTMGDLGLQNTKAASKDVLNNIL
jgi:hypothetical protein